MLTFIARMQVAPADQEKFIALAEELRALVHKHEPETVIYEFYRSEKDGEYIVLEAFTNEAAEEHHQNTDYFKRIAPDLIGCLKDGLYVREYFHSLEPHNGEPHRGKPHNR